MQLFFFFLAALRRLRTRPWLLEASVAASEGLAFCDTSVRVAKACLHFQVVSTGLGNIW